MTYFERPYQLDKTLESLTLTKYNNFEVVIVDDDSIHPPNIGSYRFPVTLLHTKNKIWTNPEPAYNLGIGYAMNKNPDIIILQNAECYHVGDVISYAAQVDDNSYIVFGCFSINKQITFSQHNILKVIAANNKGASRDGENAWYNHPRHRPVGYDFCSAITAKNMKLLNGYDERFSFGCGAGDRYLLHRIKLLGLKIEMTETPFVVHQWHYTGIKVPENKAELIAVNKKLFDYLIKNNDYRAEHSFTMDL